ncbi:MAG: hypothetical protein QM758_11335 [Armatimonas sp.]
MTRIFRMPPLLLVALALLLTTRSWAQREVFSPAPAGIQTTMKRGGISLQYLRLPADSEGKEAWAHLYVVPSKNVSPEYAPPGTRFNRAYFIDGRAVSPPIPFYLDIFTSSGKMQRRRTSIVFQQQLCPMEIYARWLEPAKKRGLVLMLNFQIGNEGLWHVVPLNDHFQLISRQQFPFAFDTAEPDFNTSFSDTQTDSHGFLKIGTLVSEGDKEKKKEFWYEWQSSSFVDPLASYFVVAATYKTQKAAGDFAVKHTLQEYEIVSTREHKEYTGLLPDSYVVIVKRLRDSKQAQEYVMLHKSYKIMQVPIK